MYKGMPFASLWSVVQVSEDCLYLNVFTPLHPNSTQPLPIMIFFYGTMLPQLHVALYASWLLLTTHSCRHASTRSNTHVHTH